MRTRLCIILIITTVTIGAENDITLKSFLSGPSTFLASPTSQIALEYQPNKRSSIELGVGYAMEEEHGGEYMGSTYTYEKNGEISLSATLFYNFAEHERSDLKIFIQSRGVRTSKSGYHSYNDDDRESQVVYTSKWVNFIAYSLGFEPTLRVSDHVKAFTRFGVSVYKDPGSYFIDRDGEDYPEKLTWKRRENEALRVATTIDTWVIGIGYTF